MRWVLCTVLALAGISACFADTCTAPTQPTCDKNILSCCDANFRKALSLDTKCSGQPVYQSPRCMQQEIEQIFFGKGSDGVLSVCNSFNELRDCLGISTRSCTTYPWYMLNGYEPFIAQFTQSTYTRLLFQCGSGLDAFLQNEQCILKAYANNSQKLEDCDTQFGRDIFEDPKDACSYVSDYTGCYDKVFSDNCGIEAGWWGCEFTRLVSDSFFPVCSNTCQKAFDVNSQRSGSIKDAKKA
ncbi:Protein Y34B4A.5 [Aphelenchoides avenae]|nr:Protein Y34B4A.5 [Aphelenchus avenae]